MAQLCRDEYTLKLQFLAEHKHMCNRKKKCSIILNKLKL
jgi:hypothetical protein